MSSHPCSYLIQTQAHLLGGSRSFSDLFAVSLILIFSSCSNLNLLLSFKFKFSAFASLTKTQAETTKRCI